MPRSLPRVQGLMLWVAGPFIDKLVSGNYISEYEWSRGAVLVLIAT